MPKKPPRLHIDDENPEDYFRRLINYSFQVARLYGKADGGEVEGYGKGGSAFKNAIGLAKGIIAYHGSPHAFDKFDISKIGTGEGAQAYGHGLYFAEAEPVAKQYSLNTEDKYSPGAIARRMLSGWGDRDVATQKMIERIGRLEGSHDEDFIAPYRGALDILKSGEEPKVGHMYQVLLHADPEHLLDWDKPLSAQSPVVRKAADDALGRLDFNNPKVLNFVSKIDDPHAIAAPEGQFLYSGLQKHLNGQANATNALREAGIPGIRYLDAGSRAAGEGSSNYVMFSHEPVEILRRYADGGSIQDDYPSHYMPGVGRQVMAGGGAPGDVEGEVSYAPPEVENALNVARRAVLPPMDIAAPQAAHHAVLPDMNITSRPAPKSAHDFVQQQLNSGEPQLPQYDREAVKAWQEGAKSLGHMAAYGIPVVGPALGAYDLASAARNIASPEFRKAVADRDYTTIGMNLADLGMSAFGVPGKAAKAAAAAGMVLMPNDAEAGPVSKALEAARRLTPRGFYSPAAEAVAGIKQEKGRIGDFLNAIKGKPGVTADELRHAGIESAFAPDATVTRDEVADFLHNRLPQIQEKIYGGAPITHTPREIDPSEHYGEDDVPGWLRAMYEVGPRNRSYIIKDAGDEYYLHGPKDDNLGDYTSFEAAVQAAHDAMAGRDPVKYGEYALPGGERYREVTMQLPPTGSGSDRGFQSQHWSEPNVLAHLRMQDRVDPAGKKALHLEEIQSDWGQKGRDHGILDPAAKKEAYDRAAALRAERESLLEEKNALIHQKHSDESHDAARDRLVQIQGRLSQIGQQFMDDINPAIDKANNAVPHGPYVTSTEGWTDLALKRALREAAEGGYDKMVWTPGAAQADRYSLAKHVNEVAYSPQSKRLIARTHGGNDIGPQEPVEPGDLAKHIGKDAAKRLLAQEPNNIGIHSLRGDDLQFGGHGMLDYYDKLVPSRLQKLIKKLGHSPLIEMSSHELPSGKGDGSVMGHALYMTPELREAILKGLPAFKSGGSAIIDSALKLVRGYKDPASKYIADWKWRPLRDVQRDAGVSEVPEHVQNFGHFMSDISDKAGTEGLDPEDLIKAYMITRSSIQREGRTPAKLASYGIPVRDPSADLVRPEGQMADFLSSQDGVRFLNEARKGELSQDVVDAAMRVMKPFGMAKAEPDAMDWARRNLVEQTPLVSDMVARARAGESDPSEWRAFTEGVRGVGPAKSGFLASLLGRGDMPTLDARQAILHTGLKNAEVQGIMGMKGGKVGHEAVDRLAARQRAMDLQLPQELDPFYQHLAHHTVWDAVGNEQTTHQDIIDAMKPRADGGRVGYEDGGVVDRALSFLSQFNPVGTAEAAPNPFVRKVFEAVRHQYAPGYVNDLSKVKLTRPVSEMSFKLGNERPMIQRQIVEPEQFAGSAFVPAFGDRSRSGAELLAINGQKLRRPVNLQGGESFMRDAAAQSDDFSIWGGAPAPSGLLARKGREAAERGLNPHLIYSAMGPESSDYSHMTTDTLLGLMNRKRIDDDIAADFDSKMRREFKTLEAIPAWRGIKAKGLEDWLYGGEEAAGLARTKMAKVMDAAGFRKAGMPEVGAVRAAITEPDLLGLPNYASGHSIGLLDPAGRVIESPLHPHSSYSTQVGAPHGAPGYVGGFEYSVPADIHFKDEIDRILAEKPGLPESNVHYTLRKRVPVVEATPEWIDNSSEFIDLMRREYGRRTP